MAKTYDKEFKLYAVKLVVEERRKGMEIARELDIANQTLSNGVKKYREEQEVRFVGSGNLKLEDQSMHELQRRLRDLEEENMILKRPWTSSQKTRSNLWFYRGTPIQIRCSEDVQSIRRIKKWVLRVKTS
ncbi:transposase [Bacillus nitratireducens]|uniref:transposase n=1 Tax=Bacillus nitratireducens TaxID=2026193 RepID=UPI00119E58E7|nr:transposase [Bacillus nitratireducens]